MLLMETHIQGDVELLWSIAPLVISKFNTGIDVINGDMETIVTNGDVAILDQSAESAIDKEWFLYSRYLYWSMI